MGCEFSIVLKKGLCLETGLSYVGAIPRKMMHEGIMDRDRVESRQGIYVH